MNPDGSAMLRWSFVVALAAVLLVACTATADDVRRRADERHEAGEITAAERDVVHETADQSEASEFARLGEGLLWSLGTILAGYLGLRRLPSRTGLTQEEVETMRRFGLLVAKDLTFPEKPEDPAAPAE